MATDLEKAEVFYNRAAELRSIAENVKDAETRSAMITWAASYEALAHRIVQAAQSEGAVAPETDAPI